MMKTRMLLLAAIAIMTFSGTAHAAILFEDEFDTLNDWQGNKAAGQWTTTTTGPCSGLNAGYNQNTGGAIEQINQTNANNTNGYSQIQVNFTIDTGGLDAGEDYARVEWCAGGTCTNLFQENGSVTCTAKSFILPGGAENQSDFRIKVSAISNANAEKIRIDALKVHGIREEIITLRASNPTPSSVAIFTYESVAFNGTCEASGGTAQNTEIRIQDNRTGAFTNSSTDHGTAIFTNVTGYTIGSLSGASSNFFFNVTANNTVGKYDVRVQCYATNTVGKEVNSSTPSTLTVSQLNGTLAILTINQPANASTNIVQNNTFALNATAICDGANPTARCYQVNITARRNSTSATADTNISAADGATPLFIMGGQTTQMCASDLNASQNCTVNWTVNASGAIGLRINITANASSSSSSIATAQGDNVSRVINITAPGVAADRSFTIYISAANASGWDSESASSTEQITFNSSDPSGKKVNATAIGGANQSANTAMFRYENTGNVNINITLAFGSEPTCTGGTITVKVGWSDDSWEDSCSGNLPLNQCRNITTTAKHIANLSAAGVTRDVWLWTDFDSCQAGLDTSQTLTHESVEP